MPLSDIKQNLKEVILSASSFTQLFYISQLLWWGIGGMCGVRFIINQLNYFVSFPINALIALISVLGFVGLFYKKSGLNVIFGVCNVFLFTTVSLTFLLHSPILSISAGNYFIENLGAIWLLFRIQRNGARIIRYGTLSQ